MLNCILWKTNVQEDIFHSKSRTDFLLPIEMTLPFSPLMMLFSFRSQASSVNRSLYIVV
jgi:hypothetical protein